MTDEPIFHKNQPIWWHIAISRTPRPSWISKGREWQAGVIRDADAETKTAVIMIMNEERKLEGYIVPFSQLKPRVIP